MKRRNAACCHADAKTQVNTALHLLIGHFMNAAFETQAHNDQFDSIKQMLFVDHPQKFASFEAEEHPKMIRHWLSRLHLPDQPHRLHSIVKENSNDGQYGVNVLEEQNGPLSTIADLFKTPELTNQRARDLQALLCKASIFLI